MQFDAFSAETQTAKQHYCTSPKMCLILLTPHL